MVDKNELTHNEIDILLVKYFGGEASQGDLLKLDTWLAESEENQKQFDEVTHVYQNTRPYIPAKKPDTQKALAEFKKYISKDSPKSKPAQKSKLIYWVSAAAAVAVLAFSLFMLNDSSKTEFVTTNAEQTITLPDKNTIILAANSSLQYDKTYGKTEYNLNLVGAAKFDIKHHGKKNIKVFVDDIIVEDIGTEFAIEAYPSADIIKISVKSGIVNFYSANNEGIKLLTGERGMYIKSNKRFKKIIEETKIDKDILLTFNNMPLSDVVSKLSATYNVKIVLSNNHLASLPINVTFKNEDIDTVLGIISETLSVKIIKQGGMYTVSE